MVRKIIVYIFIFQAAEGATLSAFLAPSVLIRRVLTDIKVHDKLYSKSCKLCMRSEPSSALSQARVPHVPFLTWTSFPVDCTEEKAWKPVYMANATSTYKQKPVARYLGFEYSLCWFPIASSLRLTLDTALCSGS